jgi:mannose-6-phosphate isomerase-like protein (cupin superfamily)
MTFKDRVATLLSYPSVYDEQLAFRIDEKGMVHRLTGALDAFSMEPKTLKIEAVERVFADINAEMEFLRKRHNHRPPMNAHLFWAQPGSPSFDLHTDPIDVIIELKYGTKVMEVNGERHVLDSDHPSVYIPAGTPHRAINEAESITISYGFLDYLETRWTS